MTGDDAIIRFLMILVTAGKMTS